MADERPARGAWFWIKRFLLAALALLGTVLVVAVVLALILVGTDGLGAEPDPATTYEAAVDRYERIAAGDAWEEGGTNVTVVRLPKRLGLPRDVVDVAQPKGKTDVVYPVLVALAEGKAPPAVPSP